MLKKRKLFKFCPRCGSQRLVRDMPSKYRGLHRLCLNCGRRWEIKLDVQNHFE